MPAKSKAQFRFMQAIQHGSIIKPGLSAAKASEFTSDVNYKSLPAKHNESRASYNIGKALDKMVRKKKKK